MRLVSTRGLDCDACIQDRACGLCYRGVSGFCLPARNEHGSSLGPCAMDNQKEEAFTFALDYCPSPYVWIVMAGIFLYCLFYCPGLAALTFTINVEIYPMWARSICTSLVVGLCWLSNTIITFSFLTMVDVFTIHGTFWFFAAMCILGFILLAIFLPETKYHNLEEVEELFMTSQRLQRHLQQRESSQIITAGKDQQKLIANTK
ncbi:hypothetical protein ACOMHN_014135 [Nucella lapillus]